MAGYIRMSWSKLKRNIESHFADSVVGRVSLFMTGYHKLHNEAGRWAFKIDGVEVEGVGDFTSWKNNPASSDRMISLAEGNEELRRKGLHERNLFLESLCEYQILSIDKALASPDVVIRSLAILDKRTGKNRLHRLAANNPAHPLEKRCLAFRLEAESHRSGK